MTLKQLQSEFDARLKPQDYPLSMTIAQANAYEEESRVLWARLTAARSAASTLADVEPRLATLETWQAHLIDWRQKLCDKLEVCPPRDPQLSGLRLSVLQIDRGLDFRNEAFPARLPLDDLMAESGISTTGTLAETCAAHWRGSLPAVGQRLRELQSLRDDAQVRLDRALNDEQPS